MPTQIARTLWTSLLLISGLAVGCSSAPKAQQHLDRKPAANFTLADASGAKVALADYKGKVVLLNFWATWCGPCKVEIPWFIEFNKTYKDRGLAVVGVSLDDDGWKSVKPYLAEKKIDYTVVVGNDAVSKSYGDVESLPTTFIIDQDGRIAFTHTGLVSKDTYEKEIQSLLGDQRAALN
ncbi:MAG TPA: TlpA disulfide reductase family protein [Bryobacteraceae bacterium]|nr:TlpA disulfide reductase family protein [Bryobacteraceae bacterium]